MITFFQLCYDFNVIDVNIVLDHPVLGVSVFTYYLFKKDKCRIIKPELYFQANQGYEALKEFFPQKLDNFHGCPLRVTSRPVEPFFKFKGDGNNPKPVGDWENLSGIEGMVLKTLAKTLNFKIQLLPIPSEPTLMTNTTGYGCYAELLRGNADIAIGSLSNSDFGRLWFSVSVLYHFTPYKYVIQGGRILDSMDRLFRPLSFRVWMAILYLYLFGVLMIYVLKYSKSAIRQYVQEPGCTRSLELAAVYLGQPLTRPPRRTFPRTLFIMWVFLTLILRSAYQGLLYDAIRLDKFLKVPLGYDDLIKWNFIIYLSPEVAQLEMFNENRKSIRVVHGDFRTRLDILAKNSDKYATIAMVENYVNYMETARFLGINLYMISETIYVNQLALYLPKQSIFSASLNKKLSSFHNSGLLMHFRTWFSTEKEFFKWTLEEPPIRAISVIRLKSLFCIYVMLISIGLVIFVLELLSTRVKIVRKIIEFLNL
ncbi:uncharacterized protein LOC129912274 [Episyrphus balteatus]|uniref:uncharacterized protein LOC129912274 n=1 Tax=Episyrphus balteatus TaxID=286459 RepID=UPI002484FFFC|nr:uncharacterized protein LOC129912274 [Episyrphus balteatus]